jgi:predicted nucleic acid-binding protein
MARLVLTDSSPLIALSRVNGVVWLRHLFGRIELTRSVWQELTHDREVEAGISAAVDHGWLVPRPDDPSGPLLPPHLGRGEWTTILAASAHPGECLILIDDRLARRQARADGLRVAGTAAVIAMAFKGGIIPSARDVFERLLKSDFRISAEVIRAVLDELD